MLTLVTSLLAVLSAPVAPKVAELTLEELVRLSDRVVIGRVERVATVARARPLLHPTSSGDMFAARPSVPVAEVVVERTLHGPHAERVHYLAHGTWTCDTSGAEPGERVLLFLADTRWMAGERDDFLESLAELSNGAPVYQDAHSGRGRMPLRVVDDEAFADLWSGDVILPDSIPTIDDPAEEYEWMRSAPLALLEDYVVRTSARERPDASSHRRSRAGELGAELGRAGLLAGPFDDGPRSLTYLDAHTSWRLIGPALDPEHGWNGPERPLVLRARAQWNALIAEARRARGFGR